jgi:cytochrome c-type biogenesis protein CcmF
MTEVGYFALCVGLCLSIYGLFAGIVSATRGSQNIAESGRNALVGVNLCVIIGSLALWGAILSHDFSVRYVFRHSAVDMPLLYLFTSFWSALEGSHLLWTFILTSVGSVMLLSVRKANDHYLAGLVTATAIPHTFMLLLNVWESAPLARQFPVGQYGSGMNALLQNPYMAAHPPSLFAGYCSLLIPFAYGAAALFRGRISRDWLITVRRWVLAGWAVLTVGIFLGGKWAYVELGWAGYWAWDPVENSSFMPWLAGTAFLHSLLVLDKTGKLPRLTIFLGMIGFSLTFLGTFITRSGVISSVHSFAESNIGPAYLTFVVVLFLFTVALISLRGQQLVREEMEDGWRVSKESALLFTNFFLLFLLALVMVGTLLPLIVEAVRGVRISIQEPFFNAFAPWIGVGMVGILGVGNLLKWRSGRMEAPLVTLGFPAIWATALTTAIFIRKDLDPASTVGFWLCLWTMGTLTLDVVYRLQDLRWNAGALWKFNKPFLGAYVVHVGFLVACLGFIGNYRGIEATTTLDKGESTTFYDYTFTNKGIRTQEGSNYTYVVGQVEAVSPSGTALMIEPMRSKYTNNEEWLNEVGVYSTFWYDLYLILNTFDFKSQQMTLRLSANPTVKLVWTSLVIMCIGALIGLAHTFRKRTLEIHPSGQANEEEVDTIRSILDSLGLRNPSLARKAITVEKKYHPDSITLKPGGRLSLLTVVCLALALCLFGLSSFALATDPADPDPTAPYGQSALAPAPAGDADEAAVYTYDPKLIEIGKELRCPTCQGMSVVDSNSAQSNAMKREIARQMEQGLSKDEILMYFRDRYGEWILREPDTGSALGVAIWLIPIAGLALGPILLALGLSRARRREQQEREELVAEISAYIRNGAQTKPSERA